MDHDEDGRKNLILEFTVRNDKFRGLLIEKFAKGNNESFFKQHDQPVERHCREMQRIVQSANVKRTKIVRIDVAEFYYEYFFRNKPTFRGCPMITSHDQMDKVCELNVNKEIGAFKRSVTIAQNKSKKIAERNSRIDTKTKLAEEKFQAERAKRIHELFAESNPGSSGHPGNPGSSGHPGNPMSSGNPSSSQTSNDQSSSTVVVATPTRLMRVNPLMPETEAENDQMDQGIADDPMGQGLPDEDYDL